MATHYNILNLTIEGEAVEKIKIFPETDVKEMAEGLKTAWHLNESKQQWEIFYFAESSMNKQSK